MIYGIALAGLLVALAVSALLILPVRRLAIARGWVDHPDGERKLHGRAVPTVGGAAIVGGFAAGIIALMALEPILGVNLNLPPAGLWVGALLMFCVGFYDDTRGANFKVKILFQVAAAYMLLHAGFRVDLSGFAFFGIEGYTEALYSIPLTLLWVVGVINAVNLIDGLDGLAGGVMVIAFGCLALIFGLHGEVALVLFALPIIGAVLGFLFHNFNPASVFMGDSGSLVLGFLIAAYSLQAPVHADPLIALLIPVVALGLPVMDTGLSVIRRLMERKAVCAPDHDHIHHRLSRMWPVRRSVIVLYAAATWFGAAALLMAVALPMQGLMVLAVTGVVAVMGLRTLGYLRIRSTLAMWQEVGLENKTTALKERQLYYARPQPIKFDPPEKDVVAADAPSRPKVDLKASDEAHASAA